MNIELCIFNLDGVIADTARFHYITWKELAGKFDFELSPEYYENIKGLDRIESLKQIMSWAKVEKDEKEIQSIAGLKNDHYIQMIQMLHPSEIRPGIKSFLAELKKLNVKTAIGTASKNAITILDKLGLTKQFDAIVDGFQLDNCSPVPQSYLKCCSTLEIQPSHSVVFEDAANGIKAAGKAGFYTIGIGKPEILTSADAVLQNFKGFNFALLMKLLSYRLPQSV
jgi:beta-phosphoglucomutase